MATIGKPNRRAPNRPVSVKIGLCYQPAACIHFRHYHLRCWPFVKPVAAIFGNSRQRVGQRGKPRRIARLPPAGFQHIWRMCVEFGKIALIAVEHARALRRQHKTVARQFDRRCQQVGPNHRTEFFMRHHHPGHRAGHADSQMPAQTCILYHIAVSIEIHIAPRRQRRFFSKIQRPVRAIGQPVDHKPASANIAGLLIDNGKRKIYRHGRIKRIAARRQNIAANLGGEPMRADHHRLVAMRVGRGQAPVIAQIIKLEGNYRCKQCQHCTENNCNRNAVRFFHFFRSLFCVRH